jgi:hypothetical protein
MTSAHTHTHTPEQDAAHTPFASHLAPFPCNSLKEERKAEVVVAVVVVCGFEEECIQE